MSNPRGRNESVYANQPVRLSSLPAVRVDDPALQKFLDAVREWLEVRGGSRGDRFERAVTERDLVQLGIIDEHTFRGPSSRMMAGGGPTPSSQSNGGVLVQTGTGYTVVDYSTFAKTILDSKLFRSMVQSLTDPARFDSLPAEVRSLLLKDIAAEAAARGADIRHLEEKVQTSERSMALAVQEVTASVGSAVAGVRETAFAAATATAAVAGTVTQVRAALGDPSTFTGAGVTLEQAMFGSASVEGLYGQYTVKVDAGGKIAGIGLAIDAPVGAPVESAVIIQADKFAVVAASDTIADPMNPPAARIPFGIDTVNNTIYINGNVRINTGGPTLASIGSGTSYWVDTSVGAVALNAAGTTFAPTTLTVSAKQQTGAAISAYAGRFIIATSPDDVTYTDRYTSAADESSYTWTVAPTSARFIRVRIYQAGGTTTLLDEQTIPVILNGAVGADGKAAITVVVQNAAHTMPAENDGTVSSYANSGVKISVWEGTTALAYNTADIGGTSRFYISGPTVDVGTITAGGYSTGAGTSTYETAAHSGMTTDLARLRWTVTVRRADGVLDPNSYPAVQTITKARKGAAGADGADGASGADGADGVRGSLELFISGSGPLTSAECDAAILAATGSSTKVLGDVVNESNGSTYIDTLRWDGASWVAPGVVINGALLVSESVTTPKIAANAITAAKINAGEITAAKIASSSTFNGDSNRLAFAIGGSASVGGYQAGASFELNDGTKYALLVANTSAQSGGGGFGAGVNNGSSYAGTFVNSSSSTFGSNYRAQAFLANNNEAGWFRKQISSSNQTIQSEVKLAENGNAVRVLNGLIRIDQAIVTTSGGGAITYQTNAPTGTAAQTAGWLLGFSANGTEIYVPCIVK